MDGFIKLGTTHTFQMGPFIDDTDGKTAEASLTIADSDVFVSKHGAAFGAKNETTDLTGTGDARGYYDCILNTTDTNTVGTLKVCAHIAGALPVWHTFQVIPAIIFDSLFAAAATDYLPVDLIQIAGAAVSTTTAQLGVNVEQISGDANSAINLEAATDGGTYNVGGGAVVAASVTGAVGSVTGAIGSLGNTAKSDVNAEVVDALNVDTYAEPGQEAPAATQTLTKKIGYLYKAWRNKHTQTATQYSLYNDDTATVDQKATFGDDGTTATRTEIATGP